MKKLTLLVLLICLTLLGVGQDPLIKTEIRVTKRLKLLDTFIWKGDTIKSDSLVYAELAPDSVRFRRINGTWTNWIKNSAVPEGMIYPGVGIPTSTGSAWGTSITNNSTNWNTAYSWGNHATEGYLKTYSETDPIVKALNGIIKSNGTTIATVVSGTDVKTINGVSILGSGDITTTGSMIYPGAGISVSTGTSWGTSITDNSTNWNTSYSWGNHATEGYLKTYSETDPIVKAVNGIVKSNGTTIAAVVSGTDVKTINGVSILGSGDITTTGSMIYPGVGIPTSTGSAWGTSITDNSTNWNTAYGWGNHSGLYRPVAWVPDWTDVLNKPTIPTDNSELTNGAGYITGYTETDPIVKAVNGIVKSNGVTIAAVESGTDVKTINGVSILGSGNITTTGSMIYPSAGIPISTGTAWGTSIANLSANWNTAYSWGNHASAGYVTGTPWTSVGYWYTNNHPTTTAGYGLPAYPTTLPASDVYTWAKQPEKPSYVWTEIGSRPTLLSQFTNDPGFLTAESDPYYLASSWYTTTNNSTNWNSAFTNTGKVKINGNPSFLYLNNLQFYDSGVGAAIIMNTVPVSGSNYPVTSGGLFTEFSTVVRDGDFTANGIMLRTGAGTYSIMDDTRTTISQLAALTGAGGFFKMSGGVISYDNSVYSVSTHTHSGTYEPVLGNPLTNGYLLSSTSGGTRSWVAPYSLPLAANGTRGGVQIGYTATGANIPVQLSTEKMYVALTSGAINSVISYAAPNGNYANYFQVERLRFGSYSAWNMYGSGTSLEFNYNNEAVSYVTSGGDFYSHNFIATSDRRLKTSITPLDFNTGVDNIRFVSFFMKNDTTNRLRYGVIAQEVEEFMPEVVHTDANGQKSVAYNDLFIAKLASLEKRVSELEHENKCLKAKKSRKLRKENPYIKEFEEYFK